MPVTRFPTTADGVMERMTGFMAHLRLNGLNVGVAETEIALRALNAVDILDRFERFDELFKAYWFARGRRREREQRPDEMPRQKDRWTNRSLMDLGREATSAGKEDSPAGDNDDGEAQQSGEGKLVASNLFNVNKADLREFMKPEDLARALDIRGTPTFVVEDQIVRGAVDADTLRETIEQKRKS